MGQGESDKAKLWCVLHENKRIVRERFYSSKNGKEKKHEFY
jgi:hypothetical protein